LRVQTYCAHWCRNFDTTREIKSKKTLFLRHEAGIWFIEAKNVVVGSKNIFLL